MRGDTSRRSQYKKQRVQTVDISTKDRQARSKDLEKDKHYNNK